ncbi:MAG TPA: M20/M25/M40 family metallo-hydrolase, partial [Longimicrobium sp.]|nr:M20/M25/M40 family metallo-hydrolase [Longimicrobium sp.]
MPQLPAEIRALLGAPALQRLRAAARRADQPTLHEQLEIASIAAPPFAEGPRGEHVLRRFREIGLSGAHADELGNVIGTVPAANGADEAPVVIAAHLDTVFAAGTDVTPRRQGARIYAPGIADNSRGVAGMLAVARLLVESGVRGRRPVVFVGTVGEEGSGDLRGVKHLFREGSPYRAADAFIALDGSGL